MPRTVHEKVEPKWEFPAYDLESLIREARKLLKIKGLDVSKTNVYKAVSEVRRNELRTHYGRHKRG